MRLRVRMRRARSSRRAARAKRSDRGYVSQGRLRSYGSLVSPLASATADRRAVDTAVVFTSAIVAATKTLAHGLNHLQAIFVVGRAAQADAVHQHLAGAIAAIKAALAAHLAIAYATNAAHTVFDHVAKVLQCGTSCFVVARAVDLAALAAFFHADLAAHDVLHCDWLHHAAGAIHRARWHVGRHCTSFGTGS